MNFVRPPFHTLCGLVHGFATQLCVLQHDTAVCASIPSSNHQLNPPARFAAVYAYTGGHQCQCGQGFVVRYEPIPACSSAIDLL